ncbi:MAG: choice-of-anchor Q domain-containing protein [Chloroflexota bacterium]
MLNKSIRIQGKKSWQWLGVLLIALLFLQINWQAAHADETVPFELLSVDSSGNPADADALIGGVSDDMRYVVFSSEATNLVPNDNNGKSDIFLHDRVTGETSRISEDSSGIGGDDDSDSPDISGNGRYIAYHSFAKNLATGADESGEYVFLFDRTTGETETIAQVYSKSDPPTLSGDGRYLAYMSDGGGGQINLYDQEANETWLVTESIYGGLADKESQYPEFGNNDRYLVFYSETWDLVPEETNTDNKGFVYDMTTREIKLVAYIPDGDFTLAYGRRPAISDDGQYIVFEGERDAIYLYDQTTESVTQVNGLTYDSKPVISGNGRFIISGENPIDIHSQIQGDVIKSIEPQDILPETSGRTRREAAKYFLSNNGQELILERQHNGTRALYAMTILTDCEMQGYSFPYTVGTINSDHVADLRTAIACASGSDSPVTITLAQDIVLTTTDNTTEGNNGLPVISSQVTLDGANYTIERDASYTSCGDGFDDFRFFYVAESGQLTLQNLTLENGCVSGTENAGRGGAIYNKGLLTVQQSTLANNQTTGRAGGIYNSGDASITATTLDGNSSSGWGGGLLNGNNGQAIIDSSTFSNNRAKLGGGFFNNNITIVRHSTISNNSSGSYGGGIYNAANDMLDITFSTIANNNGEGIYDKGGQVILFANILANNSSGDCLHQGSLSGSSNLIKDAASACGLADGVDSNLVGADPALEPLADNGGSTQTQLLGATSAARDHISANGCGWPVDQRGQARPQGTGCDVGAVEMSVLGGTAVGGNMGLIAATGGTLLVGLLALLVWRRREI